MRRLLEGSVYSRKAFIANFATTTVNLLGNLNIILCHTMNSKKLGIKVVCLLNLLVMAILVYTAIENSEHRYFDEV